MNVCSCVKNIYDYIYKRMYVCIPGSDYQINTSNSSYIVKSAFSKKYISYLIGISTYN